MVLPSLTDWRWITLSAILGGPKKEERGRVVSVFANDMALI